MMYISAEPVGSGFAKALQQGLLQAGLDKVFRVDHARGLDKWLNGNNVFFVTNNPVNKIEQFRRFAEAQVSAPKSATSEQGARDFDCKTIFARTLVNSTNGRGIVEFDRASEQYPRAPLYTEYIPKKAEYRVHVVCGKVVDVQQKKKKRGFEGTRDTRIRNVANGYVYTRSDIVEPNGIRELAVQAVESLKYCYGAVDIIYNEKQDKCFVLEVNSRPGLMGTTLVNYVNAIKEML